MPIIKINVKDKIATLDNPEDFIVCGNSDYTIQFSFDSEWSGYSVKTARFVTDDGYQEVTFNGINCTAPKISNALGVKIGVYAGNLHTTTPAYVNAQKSILCGSRTHVTPSTDVYNQLVAAIDAVADDKVDKITGKGLSTNDYTNTDKQKVQNAIADAPIDNKQYARKNGAWTEVEGGSTAWNDITGKPSTFPPSSHTHDDRYYTESEVNTLLEEKADIDDIPTKTSELTNDSGFLTQHQSLAAYATQAWVIAQGYITSLAGYATEAWVNAKNYATQSWVEAKGYLTEHQSLAAYRTSAAQDVIDAAIEADIPTKTSDLTNDSGFLTSHQSLAAYRTSAAQDVIDANKANDSAVVHKTGTETVTGDKTFTGVFSTYSFTDDPDTGWQAKNGMGFDFRASATAVYVPTPTIDASAATKAYVDGHHDASKQDTSNLVTSLSAQSTDTQYPSAKCVYDLLPTVTRM